MDGMTVSRGFTLIELLVVIAVISILAAILFPVFAQAKAAAKKTQCISNLAQIGKGTLLYMADYDDRFPFAVDPIDAAQPGIWAGQPQFQALIPTMPFLHEALQPYIKSLELFHCPSDSGTKVLDDRPYLDFVNSPTMHAKWKTSYFFRTEIAFKQLSQTGLEHPAETNYLFDAAGHWHGWGGEMQQNDPDLDNKLSKYRYNTLYGDMHVKSLHFDQLQQAWNTTL
ncbi:MAG: prepilin-type N-terminal cleavage/methylation domain-containing protein [Armatimonadetes bacterium]|nr:prepilin-type N-terminal cleavage/methylation domain-containing protein [Armatimonadota bacterium]MBS1712514.1 prepilin-type N-terminal cleavage/methylation domain-containing protein [Armatimonadota bacterium]